MNSEREIISKLHESSSFDLKGYHWYASSASNCTTGYRKYKLSNPSDVVDIQPSDYYDAYDEYKETLVDDSDDKEEDNKKEPEKDTMEEPENSYFNKVGKSSSKASIIMNDLSDGEKVEGYIVLDKDGKSYRGDNGLVHDLSKSRVYKSKDDANKSKSFGSGHFNSVQKVIVTNKDIKLDTSSSNNS